MKFESIYIQGNEVFINHILNMARSELGDTVNAITINPLLAPSQETSSSSVLLGCTNSNEQSPDTHSTNKNLMDKDYAKDEESVTTIK